VCISAFSGPGTMPPEDTSREMVRSNQLRRPGRLRQGIRKTNRHQIHPCLKFPAFRIIVNWLQMKIGIQWDKNKEQQ
jgi:hypothetical protein